MSVHPIRKPPAGTSAVTVHRVDRPGYATHGYEVRNGETVVDSGLIRLDGALFAAWSDATRAPSLWSLTVAGVLERLAHEYGGPAAV